MRGLFVGTKHPEHYQFCSNLGPTNQPLDSAFWNEARIGNVGFAELRSPTHDGNTSFALALYQNENVAIATINYGYPRVVGTRRASENTSNTSL
ncbi:hypothetical protein JCM19240_1981 [Vibrio maritimus]|uniref:Uncharacterized protein n=1 Tax=Vibrio maritimus TaxID=990268 RepID=A0A090SZR5_9VIBR|nr:hypothetical protein JCM19240_1981 [Vibrio maritimus]